MSDYIAIRINPVTSKWNVVVFLKECESMAEAKEAAEEMKDKIAQAFKELRDE